METELEGVVRLLAQNRWPFRLHATYDESISRFLDVFERVNRDIPFDGLHWFFDHCETISQRNIERVKALGGGIAIQHRMAYQGEYFIQRYGRQAAEKTPPIADMLAAGVPVGAGTDATRVASYNPFVALYWLVSGRTVGGTELYAPERRLDRMEALRLYTVGSTWFSNEGAKKGSIEVGKYADLAVLNGDYFGIAEDRIKYLESVLTVVNGSVVYASAEFGDHAPPRLPVSPNWSPVGTYGGYYRRREANDKVALRSCHAACATSCTVHGHAHDRAWKSRVPVSDSNGFWGALGCSCFSF
jgi:predicted amidohydrolase YtcJ